MACNSAELLKKIHSKGYWEIVLAPATFEPQRVPSLTASWELVRASEVSLRGWNYPYANERERGFGQDWVDCGVDFMGNIEYWRFFQSGQFVHHLACREDHTELPFRSSAPFPSKYLDFIWTLYTCTECFEFAARLASRDVLVPSVNISIKLMDMSDRVLISTDIGRYLSMEYTCAIPDISFQRTIESLALIARPADIALDCALFIFERFGWTSASRTMLAEEQRKLLERRL